jgi:hypothetical protein
VGLQPLREETLEVEVSEALDKEVLFLVSRLIDEQPEDVDLVRRLWKERAALVDAFRSLLLWDRISAEALSVERAQSIARKALETVDEQP